MFDRPALIDAFIRRVVADPSATSTPVLLHQRGEMRLSPERGWSPFTAEQVIDPRQTRFVWHARIKMAPLVTAVVDDAYENGRGRLDAKLWGIFSVAHERGPEIDRGEALRYLAELPWCPTALLHNPDLRFRQIDDATVRVWVGDETTRVDLTFDADGLICRSSSDTRVRDGKAEPWIGEFANYRDFGPFRAPSQGRVRWHPEGNPFEYWRGEVTAIEPTTR